MKKTNDEWKKALSDEAYEVTRNKGTEAPFSGEYDDFFEEGKYHCVCCGAELFHSNAKFASGCGWPSFDKPGETADIAEYEDNSYGMQRIEVVCNQCDAHLGHVFPDGPTDTGQRYCINSVALKFKSKDDQEN